MVFEGIKGIHPVGYSITGVACIVTIVSSSYIIQLILKTKSLRISKEHIHVVILLSFYTLLCMSSLIPSTVEPDPLNPGPACIIQGCLIQFFSLSGILWTGYIALYRLYDTIYNRSLKNYFFPLILIMLFSLFTAIFPVLINSDDYMQDSCWCWYGGNGYYLKKKKNQDSIDLNKEHRITMYKFLFFYGIAWIVIAWIIFVFVYLIRELRKRRVEERRFSFYKYFPIILVVCFIPLTIARSFSIVNIGYSIFAAFVMRLLGFFNALAYGFNPEIKALIRARRSYTPKLNYEQTPVASQI